MENISNNEDKKTNLGFKQSNSCSTITIKGTLPEILDFKSCIKCCSYAYFLFIENHKTNEYPPEYKIFDEYLYKIHLINLKKNLNEKEKETKSYLNEIFTQRTVYKFLKILFIYLRLESDNVITFLIFLDRIRIETNFIFNLNTWKRLAIGAIMIAAKLLDDHATWNEDISLFLNNHSIKDLNELEHQTLQLLNYKLYISIGMYRRYIFELNSLGEASGILSDTPELLTPEKASKMNILERFKHSFIESICNFPRRTKSFSGNEVEKPRLKSIILS